MANKLKEDSLARLTRVLRESRQDLQEDNDRAEERARLQQALATVAWLSKASTSVIRDYSNDRISINCGGVKGAI